MRAGNKQVLGVFAKKIIQKRTQFGPYVGQLSTRLTDYDDSRLVLQVLKDGGKYFLDTPDEECGNWMMFVRPARNLEEQTLVAYQHRGEVYFTTVKSIEPHVELKVWYAADYATFMEAPSVLIKEEPGIYMSPTATATETADRWKCSSCCNVFSTFSLLESHPCGHWDSGPVLSIRTPAEAKGMGRGRVRGQGSGTTVARRTGALRGSACLSPDCSGPEGQFGREARPRTPPRGGQALAVRREGREAEPQEMFSCPLCGKIFISVDKLTAHSYSHIGERPYTCSQHGCTKAFISKYKLIRHMATHCPQKSHRCSFCEKMFHRKDHLKNHLQTHDPNKVLLRCEECGKRYNTKLGYRRHRALHAATSGDLTCGVCGREFSRTEQLLEHLKGHAGRPASGSREKRHGCDRCERRFYTRKDVRRHTVVHTGRKDFLCQFCAQRFGRKDHLTRHTKKSHAQEPLRGRLEARQLAGSLTAGSPISLKEELGAVWPVPLGEPEQKDYVNMSTGPYSHPLQSGQPPGSPHHVVPSPQRMGSMEATSPILSSRPHPPTRHCIQHHQYQLNTTSYTPLPTKGLPMKVGTRGYNLDPPGDVPLHQSQSAARKGSLDVDLEASRSSLDNTDSPVIHKEATAVAKPMNVSPMDISHLLGFLPRPPGEGQPPNGDMGLAYGQGETRHRLASPHLGRQQQQQDGRPSVVSLSLTQLHQVSPPFPSTLAPTPLPRFHQVFQ
ncbi:zinc finger protein PLAG1-like [Heptranchias perlo]|uniref:zinc finger protein PLAG1-like n=1 Tax=Heptranchias perlo TaxID=212740 RepID=UPI00355A1391